MSFLYCLFCCLLLSCKLLRINYLYLGREKGFFCFGFIVILLFVFAEVSIVICENA